MKKIVIFGCPRSGTSLLGQIFNSSESVAYRYQPLWSYEFKDFFFKKRLSDKNITKFHDKIFNSKSHYVLTKYRFRKKNISHLVWKEVRYHNMIKKFLINKEIDYIVYIFRKPKEVINSWYVAPGEFKKKWDIKKEYFYAKKINKKNYDYYGLYKWIKSIKKIISLNKKKILVICYEDLEKNPDKIIKKLFKKTKIKYSSQIKKFLIKIKLRKDSDQYSIFKKKSKVMLPLQIIQKIENNKNLLSIYNKLRAISIK